MEPSEEEGELRDARAVPDSQKGEGSQDEDGRDADGNGKGGGGTILGHLPPNTVCTSGLSRFSFVTTTTPVSMRFSTGCFRMVATAAATAS